MRKKWGIKTGYSQKSVKKNERRSGKRKKKKEKSKNELLVKGKTLGMKNEMV